MSFKIIFHFPTHLSTCKTHGLFTCFLNTYFCTFSHWCCVLILFVIVSFFFFSRLMKDWNSTDASKCRNNKDFGLCSFPNSPSYASCSFGASKPWANVCREGCCKTRITFLRVSRHLQTHHLSLNLGLLFLICINVVFIDTNSCLTSHCPVVLYQSTGLWFCTIITHFYSFNGSVSSINLISLLFIAFLWWLVNMLNDTSRTNLHRTSRFIPPLCFF